MSTDPSTVVVDAPAGGDATAVAQATAAKEVWSQDLVAHYADRTLRPAEVVIFSRYRDALAGRVLEVGCGAGRVLGYVPAIGGEAYGFDLSPAMVEFCNRVYPEAHVELGDVLDLGGYPPGPFDAVLAMYNIIDFFDDDDRRRLLAGIRKMLGPEGLLVLCTHSLEYVDAAGSSDAPGGRVRRAFRVLANHTPAWTAAIIAGLPRRISNRRRLRPLQRRGDGYAIINDWSQNHGLLLYHVDHQHQLAQFADLGYEVLECLDLDGRTLDPGEAPRTPHLHYVARPAA